VSPFKLLEKGKAPTFLDAAFGNQVLKMLNNLMAARVVPSAAGKFVVTEGGIVLDLTPMQAAAQAQQIADMNKAIAQLQGQVAGLIGSLKGATITAVCNPSDSSITVTLTIPKLP
jgi:hypothetical protein